MTQVSDETGRKLLYAGLEAGGTKCVCAIGTGPDDLRALHAVSDDYTSRRPWHTLSPFLRRSALGSWLWGLPPLDHWTRDPCSASFGWITSTPKPGWAHTDLAGTLSRALRLPVAFDTDVNAAALAEQRWGAAQGLDTFLYVTVGTGIGGGAMVNGRLLHGLLHPEMGHIRIPHDWQVDPIPWSLSLPWRLSGRARLWSGPGSPLGQAGAHAASRPSCLVAGSPLSRSGSGLLYLYTGTPTHHHGRWYHASGAFIPTCATRGTAVAQRLHTGCSTQRSARRLHCAASIGGSGWCARCPGAGAHCQAQ